INGPNLNVHDEQTPLLSLYSKVLFDRKIKNPPDFCREGAKCEQEDKKILPIFVERVRNVSYQTPTQYAKAS
ncbi:hypothetical protein, partial [Anoxybacillus flavithermus]